MNILVGCTGFVGSNLYAPDRFEGAYHSTDVEEAYGTRPELLVYAGLPAAKYLANHAPEKDMEQILRAQENIERIAPKGLVLISTIDVFRSPNGKDEASPVDTEGLHAYGLHRYQLELWVREHYPQALIIRLPGLFGKNIKKNFIYDYITRIPFRLTAQKLQELLPGAPELRDFYAPGVEGFYQVRELSPSQRDRLKGIFEGLGFSALNFTDSRSRYQYYDLSRLWGDIQTALAAGLKLWHPAVEPVSAGELFRFLSGEEFVNHLSAPPADYDFRTIHGTLFGGGEGYILSKGDVMEAVRAFVKAVGE